MGPSQQGFTFSDIPNFSSLRQLDAYSVDLRSPCFASASRYRTDEMLHFSVPQPCSVTPTWRSISEFSSAPRKMIVIESHIHIIIPIAAPSEP